MMNLSPARRWLAVGSIVIGTILTTSVLLAKPGVVKTKSGHTYYGEVSKADDGTLVVSIRGAEKRIAPDDVDTVSDQAADFKQDFEARRQKLDPTDAAGFIALTHFALDNREYMMANDAVEQAIKADPKNHEASMLRDTVRREARADRQRALGGAHPRPATTQSGAQPPTSQPHQPAAPESPAAPGAGSGNPMPPPAENPIEQGGAAPAEEKPAPTAPLAPGERRLLSADDVQKIRRLELKQGDTARIQIPQDVKRSYVAKAGLNFAQFNAKPQVEQALEILENGDNDMRERIRIMSDPESLTQFKTLKRNIVQGCATNNCHGPQAAAGNFVLYPPESDPATYTNFYILTHTSKKVGRGNGGPFGGPSEHEMVERGNGAESLLAQYALPPSKAEHPHPKASNYRGIYSGPEDARYKRLIDWMNNGLKAIPPEPDYHIDYPLPGHSAPRSTTTTRPATTQTTREG